MEHDPLYRWNRLGCYRPDAFVQHCVTSRLPLGSRESVQILIMNQAISRFTALFYYSPLCMANMLT